ncbi:MAG: hypothetical protein H7Z38_11295 [Rubrivivax sp.]|nr:hypothetical protein [Pyrinomonadaceae bacterium]
MRSFFDWFRDEHAGAGDPWLILGKGPSFAKRAQYELSAFKIVSLNHVVREMPVTLAHIIDLDVLDACADVIEKNAGALVMPWLPHVNNAAGPDTLEELARKNPVLRRLDEQGRLLWYNLYNVEERARKGSPVISVAWFSAEAVLKLLAQAGASKVRSLGLDGGAAYSNEFDDLREKTLLANGHQNFDRQFEEIAKIISRTGIDYAPLDVESPVRVYVGTTEDQMLSVKVLEYSIRKHASMTVEVFPLHRAPIAAPTPKDPKNAPRTPFSFQRFLIPALAGCRGRAIYLDSDMQLFMDIRRLWTLPFDGADLLAARKPGDGERRPQFSVMLLDCEALRWDIEEIVGMLDGGELTYERLMYEMSVARNVRADIHPAWNSLESYEPERTALVHYTDMPTQPWVSRANPLCHLWVRDLLEALDAGFVTLAYVKEHVSRGWVRPSLLYQIKHRVEDSLTLPRKAVAMDAGFVAPYEKMSGVAAEAQGARRFMPLVKTKRLLGSIFSHVMQKVETRDSE